MRRIWVGDDDPHICLAIRAWLKRYDFRVSIADGAVNGLAALDNGTFDLMIAFSILEASSPDFLRMAVRLGATRCLRKPFKPTTLLGVIDECLFEAEPHRKYVATLTAVADALSEPQDKTKLSCVLRAEERFAV